MVAMAGPRGLRPGPMASFLPLLRIGSLAGRVGALLHCPSADLLVLTGVSRFPFLLVLLLLRLMAP